MEKRRSTQTAKTYRSVILKVAPEPDAFLDLALKDPRDAERYLLDWFSAHKRVTYHRIIAAAVKSFLEYNDATARSCLGWLSAHARRISSVIGVGALSTSPILKAQATWYIL